MNTSITVYGIKTCDTCRKALKWLDAEGIEYEWVDVRNDGLAREDVQRWLDAVGAERLVNRRSTTWRQLEPAQRPVLDSELWVDVLLANPTLIKRPVFDRGGEIRVGFTDYVRSGLSAA